MKRIHLLLLSLLTVVTSYSLPPRNPEIFLDFDGTIAVTEAFENLPLTAYELLPANSEVPPWTYFQNTYYSDYLNASASLAEPSTIQEELQLQSHTGLYAAEKDSFDRVHASGLFTTVSESALEAAAKGKQVVFVGDSNSDLGPILLPPTVVGVVAGLDSGSARTIRRENNLWRADQGWEGYTGVDTGAYVLEDWRELVTLLGWTRKRKVVV